MRLFTPPGEWKQKTAERAWRRAGACAVAALLFSAATGCAEVPVEDTAPRPATQALEAPQRTALGRMAATGDGESGFSAVTSGQNAFRLLYGLALSAERTLDAQYYIWRNNRTGRLLLAALATAAERGVRVRLLLDDMELEWPDGELARLSAHPNFEVRVFNPFAGRDFKLFDALFDFDRVTHRMHNKAFIADNAYALVGGRNVGDSYFEAREGPNYRDLDLLAAGPIVKDISRSFDAFWNSAWSLPVETIAPPTGGALDVAAFAEELKHYDGAPTVFPDEADLRPAAMRDYVEKRTAGLIRTAKAEVLADDPNKAMTSRSDLLAELQADLKDTVDRSLLMEMAYYIPWESGLQMLCGLVDEGIRVRVLTNSFASNDVITAYSAYRKFREPTVRCGIELWELRNGGPVRGDLEGDKDSSSANLHTKAAVFDGRDVVIGSFNFDPRSRHLNTEIALLVRDQELARTVTAFIEESMTPERAYRLTLTDEELAWVVERDGRTTVTHEEPDTTFWRSLASELLSLLPIEDQL